MSAFTKGFQKVAAGKAGLISSALNTAKKVGIGAARVGKGVMEGASAAGGSTIGDALKLKGLSNLWGLQQRPKVCPVLKPKQDKGHGVRH